MHSLNFKSIATFSHPDGSTSWHYIDIPTCLQVLWSPGKISFKRDISVLCKHIHLNVFSHFKHFTWVPYNGISFRCLKWKWNYFVPLKQYIYTLNKKYSLKWGYMNFPIIQMVPQSSRCKIDNTNKVPYWGTTNITTFMWMQDKVFSP